MFNQARMSVVFLTSKGGEHMTKSTTTLFNLITNMGYSLDERSKNWLSTYYKGGSYGGHQYSQHTLAETVEKYQENLFKKSLNNDTSYQKNREIMKTNPDVATPIMKERMKSIKNWGAVIDVNGNTWKDRMITAINEHLSGLLTDVGYKALMNNMKYVSIYADPVEVNKIFSYIRMIYPDQTGKAMTSLSDSQRAEIFKFVGIDMHYSNEEDNDLFNKFDNMFWLQ